MAYRILTDADVDHFRRKGYVKIAGAFPRETADAWARDCFARLGYAMDDPATWKEVRIHMPGTKHVEVREFAPRVYDAMVDLLGGEERVGQPVRWSDAFIANLGVGADEPWRAAGSESPGWHKDGDFFRHFLDSPEQGLLVFVNWTDVVHQGGPTYIATDSVPVVARFLAERPEGALPSEFDFRALIGECRTFEEAVGEAGDVFLLHPFVLHATSQNPLRRIRIITNPPVHLTEPMRFDRPDPSPVEQSILDALGDDTRAYRPTAPRERVVPERVRQQEAMLREEQTRQSANA